VPDIGRLFRWPWRDPDVAVDVGSAVTKVCTAGSAVVERPTARPRGAAPVVNRGQVSDVSSAASFLRPLLDQWHRMGRRRPRVMASCPIGVTERNRTRLVEAIRRAGASEVVTVPAPVAAAIGAGVDVGSPHVELVVDVGAALTEMAAFRDGAVLRSRTLAVGTQDLAAGRCSAEQIARVVRVFWEGLPLRAQVEAIESGVTVTGGGALTPRVVSAIGEATRLPVRSSLSPRNDVVHGLASMLR
jgi:rod shape-determining protein MreB and related proteins